MIKNTTAAGRNAMLAKESLVILILLSALATPLLV